MNIPDEAIEAAMDVVLDDGLVLKRSLVHDLLEAAAPLIAAQALRDTADRWQQGEWANAPRRADRIQERIANGQHVGDWLRAQAAELESPR